MKCACPAMIEGERLGEGLTDDIACLVRKEKLRVKRNDLDCEGGALGGELRIEGFQMKEDYPFCLEHLFCTLAGNRDENEMFFFHILYCFSSYTICFCVRLFAKRFHLLKGCWILSVLEEYEREIPIFSQETYKKEKGMHCYSVHSKENANYLIFLFTAEWVAEFAW